MKRLLKSRFGTEPINSSSKSRPVRLRTVQSHSSSTFEIKPLPLPMPQLSESIKFKLQEQISIMLDKINRIIEWQGANLRQAMNYVRSSVLFKQIDGIDSKIVDEIVGQYANNKIATLEKELEAAQTELKILKASIKEEKQFSQINLRANSISIPAAGNNQTPIKPVDLRQKYPQGTLFTPKLTLQEYLKPMIQSLSESQKSHFLKLLQLETKCRRPCCQWIQNQPEASRGNLRTLNDHSPDIRGHSVYHNQKFDEYYSRYFSKDFNLSNVISITRTRTEQMDKMYSKFKMKHNYKNRQHLRNRSIA